jgi:hypothetical protein
MCLGLLVTTETAFRAEVLAYALAVLVLAIHPRKWVAITLLAYQCILLLINLFNLWMAPFGTEASRGLASHVGFRITAIVLPIMLLRRGLPMVPPAKIAAVFD